MLNYYDARIGISVYGGMFDPMSYEPNCVYYPFLAFGEMWMLGKQTECGFDTSKNGVYALSATDGKGKCAILLANTSGEDEIISTDLEGYDVYLIDSENYMTKIDTATKLTLRNNSTLYLKNF